MTGPDDIIVLKREPGPAHGLTIVTIDAPGFTQADFVISGVTPDSFGEKLLLWSMIKDRLALIETLKGDKL